MLSKIPIDLANLNNLRSITGKKFIFDDSNILCLILFINPYTVVNVELWHWKVVLILFRGSD